MQEDSSRASASLPSPPLPSHPTPHQPLLLPPPPSSSLLLPPPSFLVYFSYFNWETIRNNFLASTCAILLPEPLRMPRNASECSGILLNAPECSRMLQNAPETPECSGMLQAALATLEYLFYFSNAGGMISMMLQGCSKDAPRMLQTMILDPQHASAQGSR